MDNQQQQIDFLQAALRASQQQTKRALDAEITALANADVQIKAMQKQIEGLQQQIVGLTAPKVPDGNS